MKAHPLPWAHPLALAAAFPGEPLALLYSGVQAAYSGQISLLAVGLEETVEGDDFAPLAKRLTADLPPFANAWFGTLGYGLRHRLEQLPGCAPSIINLPPLWMGRFRHIFRFDHAAQTLVCWSDAPPALPAAATPEATLPPVAELSSTMDRATYLAHVERIVADIHAGALYQANLTRKFHGRFAEMPDTLALFARLCTASPAPYSAYLRLPSGAAILSSSPERFLAVDAAGNATTRPIKGSAGRRADPAEDAAAARTLAASAKDRAENLMIADLMRNDLSRGCAPGSVRADRLFEVTTHAHVHHLSSTVSGAKRPDVSTLDLVKACFPPGSMTGAPKLAAMKLIDRLEGIERGLYSGALGWFGGDGTCDLSVVIRTLIVDGGRFEFQVGGGIVADSRPEGELEETVVKSMGILKALGVTVEEFRRI